MKIQGLECHQFAPELNKLYLKNGVILPCPKAFSIREARNDLFPKPFKGLYCVIESYYEQQEYRFLNKVVASGVCNSRLDALRFSKKFKQQGGKLYNGDTLPPNKLRLTFKFN